MKYTGPKGKLCRREGVNLFGNEKFDRLLKRKGFPPGQHGKVFGKLSEYGRQLRAKQLAKRMFGITEKTMKRYYDEAKKMPGDAGENLLVILNMRFDNIVYLAGLRPTRPSARQVVNHGFLVVNGKKCKVASYKAKKGDVISIKDGKMNANLFGDLDKQKYKPPRWLNVDAKKVTCEVIDLPTKKDLGAIIDTQLIIGFYSR